MITLTIVDQKRSTKMTKDEVLFIVCMVCGIVLIAGIIVLGIIRAQEED